MANDRRKVKLHLINEVIMALIGQEESLSSTIKCRKVLRMFLLNDVGQKAKLQISVLNAKYLIAKIQSWQSS